MCSRERRLADWVLEMISSWMAGVEFGRWGRFKLCDAAGAAGCCGDVAAAGRPGGGERLRKANRAIFTGRTGRLYSSG
jgi:hypothetical protein